MALDGGPAFPAEYSSPEVYRSLYKDLGHHEAARRSQGKSPGMSLRDWYAGQALVALVTDRGVPAGNEEQKQADWIANRSFFLADAMLKARGDTT